MIQIETAKCDCESLFHHEHKPGDCRSIATNLIRVFGHKQRLCAECFKVARLYFPKDLEVLRCWD
jgi:hypothetical protein